MPTYNYVCGKCGDKFERFESITSSRPVKRCKKCGGEARRQISSGGGLIFKGPGFYSTDYPKQGGARPA